MKSKATFLGFENGYCITFSYFVMNKIRSRFYFYIFERLLTVLIF
jgi:hypothetical protein